MFKSFTRTVSALIIATSLSAPAFASMVEVGGAPMLSEKNIVENAVNSKGPHHAGGSGQGRRGLSIL